MENFKDRLKILRIEKGLSQKAVALKIGISPTCYAGYEQGYREPDLATLKKLCVFFETSSDYLIGLNDYDLE